jgi:predicted nuclease of predicted toxin-antitoxin system
LRFLIDAQLPPALVRRLIVLGHQAEHVFDLDLVDATDSDIWKHAHAVGAVIISKDEDFAQRARNFASKAQVVWIRLGNVTNVALWQALEPRMTEIVEALERKERLIEVI